MQFEFDPVKSKSNLEKHGIDFESAKQLWADSNRIIVEAKSDIEPRFAMISYSSENLWFAVFTIRKNKIRIISVRRARKVEKEVYESRKK
jgi:uncharacterized DUF497 family protein